VEKEKVEKGKAGVERHVSGNEGAGACGKKGMYRGMRELGHAKNKKGF
jgi:hypothetical protein